MPIAPHSFTTRPRAGQLTALTNTCAISARWSPTDDSTSPPYSEFGAIWDTGATNSVISRRVVDACNLVPVDRTLVRGIEGVQQAEVYLVSIALPNNMVFPEIAVTQVESLGDHDVLIGMDIIGLGDFAVTRPNGNTQFTFRLPPQADINFVVEDRREKIKRVAGQMASFAGVGIAIALIAYWFMERVLGA